MSRLPLARFALLALVAVALSCAVGGRAMGSSCGHYVKRLGPGFVPGKTASTLTATPADAPCGCRGPECHRSPMHPVPTSPPAPNRSFTQQDLVTIADASIALACPNFSRCGELSVRPARGFPSRLNRPPCA